MDTKVANTAGDTRLDDSPRLPPDQDEPPLDDAKQGASETTGVAAKPDGFEELVLKESGITFLVPASWKRVEPQNRIIEAELELPRTAGDEYDGRLTLMSSGGDPEENIGNRKAEFKLEPGEPPTTENVTVAGRDATLLDLRGEWKGTFSKAEPRAGYRMLYFILPFSPRSGFYAKLTGPRATIAAHEDAFREFLRSAKIARDAAK